MLDSIELFFSFLGPIKVILRARELVKYQLVRLVFVFFCAGQLGEDNQLDYKLEPIINIIELCN